MSAKESNVNDESIIWQVKNNLLSEDTAINVLFYNYYFLIDEIMSNYNCTTSKSLYRILLIEKLRLKIKNYIDIYPNVMVTLKVYIKKTDITKFKKQSINLEKARKQNGEEIDKLIEKYEYLVDQSLEKYTGTLSNKEVSEKLEKTFLTGINKFLSEDNGLSPYVKIKGNLNATIKYLNKKSNALKKVEELSSTIDSYANYLSLNQKEYEAYLKYVKYIINTFYKERLNEELLLESYLINHLNKYDNRQIKEINTLIIKR